MRPLEAWKNHCNEWVYDYHKTHGTHWIVFKYPSDINSKYLFSVWTLAIRYKTVKLRFLWKRPFGKLNLNLATQKSHTSAELVNNIDIFTISAISVKWYWSSKSRTHLYHKWSLNYTLILIIVIVAICGICAHPFATHIQGLIHRTIANPFYYIDSFSLNYSCVSGVKENSERSDTFMARSGLWRFLLMWILLTLCNVQVPRFCENAKTSFTTI